MRSFEPGWCAAVVGASGGLGGALVSGLSEAPGLDRLVALGRRPAGDAPSWLALDLEREDSIAAAAALLPDPLRLVVVATGLLHGDGMQPEKSYRALDADVMARSYRINVIGPALVAKHVLPRLPRSGRCVFAVLGARVGSIGDNRSGGWHSYRASKAALAMLVRNLAIETARRAPDTVVVGLHPGTVATGLSEPFRRGVAPGQLFEPADAAARLLGVIDELQPARSGSVLDWKGEVVPP